MGVQVNAPAMRELVDENAEVERLGTGFTFTEGPLWNPSGYLLFSDMPGDVRRRWDEQHGVSEVANPSNKGNGMTWDNDGRLIVCEHVTSSVVRMDPDGTGSGREVLATHYDGKELNSPNDVIVKRDGAIYFTDPTYGRMPGFGIEREQELDFQGVYRIAARRRRPRAAGRRLRASPTACASPPTRSCSTSTTPTHAHIRVFDVAGDGTLENGRVLADGIGSGDLDDRRPGRRDEARRARQHLGHRARRGVRVRPRRHRTSARSRSPRTSATSTGAARTGTGCSSRPRRRCTACSARSPATDSPT